jgi:hypothetical protein
MRTPPASPWPSLFGLRRHLVATVLAVAGASQAAAQTLEVRPENSRARLGDVLTFQVIARLPSGMELIDLVPHPLVPPPRGIRLVSADTLRRRGDGTLRGTARLAFYRLGPQPVPTLALLFRRTPGDPPDTLVHLPVSIEIAALLPAGNPPLKDIKPLRAPPGPVWIPFLALIAVITGGFWWIRRRRRGGAAARRPEREAPIGPFEAALTRLDEIERASRASGNGVLPLYADSVDVVRRLLLDLGAIPHHGLTTREVSSILPGVFPEATLRDQCETLFRDADLVKFANLRPDLAAALEQLTRARRLIEAWRTASVPADLPVAGPPSRRAAE